VIALHAETHQAKSTTFTTSGQCVANASIMCLCAKIAELPNNTEREMHRVVSRHILASAMRRAPLAKARPARSFATPTPALQRQILLLRTLHLE
jgi:hypothetical protein